MSPTTSNDSARSRRERARLPILLGTALVVSTAGLVYELLAGALASTRLGDSITQFSLTIGVYLFAMGVGAYLSGYVRGDSLGVRPGNLPRTFVEVELALALVGGLEGPLLFLGFGDASIYRVVLYSLLSVIGVLVGVEIPLLMRILEGEITFGDLVAKVLGFDYLGALVGSLAFALFFVPTLGLLRTSIVFGLLNLSVAGLSFWLLQSAFGPRHRLLFFARSFVVLTALVAAFVYSPRIERWGEGDAYGGIVLYAEQTPYQRIVVTRGRGSFQLHLNGNLQFSSADEYRYHEALVHPAFAASQAANARSRNILVLGGGDGLAVREILKYPDVQSITLVDLDPAMTRLGTRLPVLRTLNHNALDDARVHVVNEDAFVWLANSAARRFDIALVDFPDPNNFALGKLYTTRFYRLVHRVLSDTGTLVVQSTSPLFARQSFWCIENTIVSGGFVARAYHALVPSFGEWGFVLARKAAFAVPTRLAVANLRFLNDATLSTLFTFGPDISEVPAPINRLNDQPLVPLYEHEWAMME